MAFFHTIETQLSLKPSYAFVSMFPHYEISGLRCEESLDHGLGLLILLEWSSMYYGYRLDTVYVEFQYGSALWQTASEIMTQGQVI